MPPSSDHQNLDLSDSPPLASSGLRTSPDSIASLTRPLPALLTLRFVEHIASALDNRTKTTSGQLWWARLRRDGLRAARFAEPLVDGRVVSPL